MLAYGILFILTVVLYAKTGTFGFVLTWDDAQMVVDNPVIRSLAPANLLAMFSRLVAVHYAPLQDLSFALEYALRGRPDPATMHITNALLHALNACLVMAVVGRVTANPTAGLMVAVLFAVHPLNVENVAWISERRTLLATAFFLGAFGTYMRFRESGRRLIYAAALVLFACAALAKITALVLPLVLVVYELLLKPTSRRRVLPALAFVVIAVPAAAPTLLGYRTGAGFLMPGELTPEVVFGIVYPTSLTIYWKYMAMIAWPFDLSAWYGTELYRSFLSGPVVAALLAWLAVSVLVFTRGTAQVRFWYLWFWICFLPTSNIVPLNTYYQDRYMYVPAIGLFVMLALLVEHLGAALEGRRLMARRILSPAVLIGAVLYLAPATYLRMDVWRDDLSLWEDAAAKYPGEFKPTMNLAVTYHRLGRLEAAERTYVAAARVWPNQMVLENLRALRAEMARRPPVTTR